jgi:hypothetical protein
MWSQCNSGAAIDDGNFGNAADRQRVAARHQGGERCETDRVFH